MPDLSQYEELDALLARLRAAHETGSKTGYLRALVAIRKAAESFVDSTVIEYTSPGWAGMPWQDVADALGVSKQAAHRKYGEKAGRRYQKYT